jgi:hypothetical protein
VERPAAYGLGLIGQRAIAGGASRVYLFKVLDR